MRQLPFILFADCIPVKGFNRSIICDTKSNQYYFIPNGLYAILETYNGKSIAAVKKAFQNEYDAIIEEYFDFLIQNQLIFFNPNPELFPRMSMEWNTPSLITNIIIDYDEIIHDFSALVPQFEKLKCSYLQLRFYRNCSLEYLNSIDGLLKKEKSRIVSVDFILPFDESFTIEELNILLAENSRIHSIILFNSPCDKSYEPVHQNMGYVMMVKRNVSNEKHCGIINAEYFYSNIKLFSESQQYNTCLNKKLAIDKNGNIKNCPSMPESFGNIKDITLEEGLNNPNFKKYWNITKDQITVCKDCEFRHICTDCRAYIEDPDNNIYSKPLKCGYDPYTNQWSEWSTNPLKQRGIEFYGKKSPSPRRVPYK
ncbi:grasp-with-spasm system SPASM domain peptide maturase [Flavobacterium sp. CLA17]|uniref:grasp-with-spasm system SPASM domain peptide maturase n=1 Tax=Flavobacterium sp. CLA17 TaxID=2724135 RepID=UPI0014920388|nr:grasp-with-spasm system SPASM domain peptide maturase [Flavobacterium sp. CLA17]QSB25387.1 grasp-with-spasm system SPASM domain peptide maturase [Flavobacterium sp. CLA17]